MPRLRIGIGQDGQPQGGFNVGHLTDDGLRRLRKTYRRQIEDIADGDPVGVSERSVRVWLNDVEREIELRDLLAEVWRAQECGTDSYTDFMGSGGLSAVVCCQGLSPSYGLAVFLDRTNHLAGRASVLEWEDEPIEGAAPSVISSECPRCGYDHYEDILDRPLVAT